jgi:hypothetical protein
LITLAQLQNFLLQQKPRTSDEETKLRQLKENRKNVPFGLPPGIIDRVFSNPLK